MKKLRKYFEYIYHQFVQLVFRFLGALPKKELFFFESFHGRQYSDNPRAIFEYLQENHPDILCVWAVKRGFEEPFIKDGIPYVRRLGWQWLLTMPRAKYWVFNTRMPHWMRKSKHTIYIQTWHGTPLKRLGLDIEQVTMPGTSTTLYRKNFINESKRWDYLLSPNPYSTDVFRSAFSYKGKVLEIGYPRNDILLNKETYAEKRQQILSRLGLNENQKIILYAPTWRDTEFYSKGSYKFNNQFPFKELVDNQKDIVLLLRTHYLITNQFDYSEYQDQVINCSSYPDIRDLYLVADLLITDYSSILFDYAYTNRPMIFYMYDYENYKENIRGFYFDPEKELPGPIVRTQEELLAAISRVLNTNTEDVDEKYANFITTYCTHSEQSASARLIEETLLKK